MNRRILLEQSISSNEEPRIPEVYLSPYVYSMDKDYFEVDYVLNINSIIYAYVYVTINDFGTIFGVSDINDPKSNCGVDVVGQKACTYNFADMSNDVLYGYEDRQTKIIGISNKAAMMSAGNGFNNDAIRECVTYECNELTNKLPLNIFSKNVNGVADNILKNWVLYLFTIIENGKVVRNYYPCVDLNGTGYLYDATTNVLFNSKNGLFKGRMYDNNPIIPSSVYVRK